MTLTWPGHMHATVYQFKSRFVLGGNGNLQLIFLSKCISKTIVLEYFLLFFFKQAVSKLFNQQFQSTEGVILFIIIGDVHQFIVYCLIP